MAWGEENIMKLANASPNICPVKRYVSTAIPSPCCAQSYMSLLLNFSLSKLRNKLSLSLAFSNNSWAEVKYP